MRSAALLCLGLVLTACGGGPDGATLRKDVEARLAEALPQSGVVMQDFARRGSQADTKAPAGETRRIMYFDVDLKLARDVDLGSWDGPGVAGVISALGAGPKGIAGITSGGNKAGDVLRVHGTALYKREGDKWTPATTGGFKPSAAPAYATNEAHGAAATLAAIRKVLDSAPTDTTRAVIQEELTAAQAAISARLARAAQGYAIAAGPEFGQYLRFAQALADGKDSRVVALVTRGGDDNLQLLREGKVVLALAQGDAALEAYEGKGRFAGEGPFPGLRALGSLYPEPVHILVRADSALRSVADLRGKRVAIGLQGSASRATALRVLQAHGIEVKDVSPLELSIGDALVGLRQDRADAVIQVIGVPADSVRDALAAIPLRLLPMSERAIESLVGARAGYFAYRIPRAAYANQKSDVPTVATAALLLAGGDLSESEVTRITRLVFERGRDFAARGSAQGTQVSVATARQGLSIPLHAAAERALVPK